jgi:hypothetical protein
MKEILNKLKPKEYKPLELPKIRELDLRRKPVVLFEVKNPLAPHLQ